ncbi:MAG: hypothetical protein QGG42_00565 [Phycisphaerae bacterium]|nr:hypothetical protein [Phycisphaerae bacterium]
MKKNIRKIPQAICRKLENLRGKDVVAGCALKFSAASIRSGVLSHLGVELQDDGLHYPERIVPPCDRGKYSRRNVEGWEEVRRDLPMETHHHPVETPNWGDSYNGTHTVWLPSQAYPKDFHPARELEIILKFANTEPTEETFVLMARVAEVLIPSATSFDVQLLEDLNILQENLGACGVEPADLSIDEYARTLHLSWDILPPGSREEALQCLFKEGKATQQQQDTAASRYDFFQSMNPRKIIVGSSGFRRYFGALLEDDLVVFENIRYGNAVYIMYENWEELGRQSRIELLTGRLRDQFDRVIHKDGWETKVRLLVEAKRKKIGVDNRITG